MRNTLNVAMALGALGSGVAFMGTDALAPSLTHLSICTALSFSLGLHTTASIGGADMPVVITVLNSYSGWAICAEGFMLNNDLLVVSGALIGAH